MSTYNVDLQTNYSGVAYNWPGGSGKTIYSSGCCPSSVRNILVNLCGTKTTIKEMCKLAISCGARVNGGTLPETLLKATKSKYGGFTYSYTKSDSTARSHVKNGGMALCHTTGSNKLFSTSGHFVAMVAATSSRVTIIDPYITSNKWSIYNRGSYITTTGTKGVVTTSYSKSDESFDYYYLISKATNNVSNTTNGKDIEDMTESEVRKLINTVAEETAKKTVSGWAKDVFECATKADILDGTMPQSPMTREQFAAVICKLGLIDNGSEPSAWAKDAFEKATKAGILDGTNPHGLVTREMLAQVFENMNIIDAVNGTNDSEV